ncbi:iron (metal) dependent repressor, DtxR family [Abditibacterium utsteinense]|uniref:Transcriptional regulator MntR n=1 Tax=Abditibacterium utsteinense TaxID=1960156 RepID=A0A2S8SPZ2_9BACT|nr:metal-dependent transcriptional regulator [Abditibacterium utsteinense]PQV62867.1 iron (metal) dependent repressor, DtxR family [Abditibacterium utsteinense]
MRKTDSQPLGRAPLSAAVEDYLKAIHALREDGLEVVSTQSIANRLQVAPPSATAMLKKLDALGLAHHEPYRGVELSAAGEKIALEIVRHHRIIETFLAEILGLDWDCVHDEAERLEHVLSERVEAAMMRKLGNPTRDPHGAPIPGERGELTRVAEIRLSEVEAGFAGQISRVEDENSAILRHLRELGLQVGTRFEILRAEAVEGILKLRLENEEINQSREITESREITLGIDPAARVWVEKEAV